MSKKTVYSRYDSATKVADPRVTEAHSDGTSAPTDLVDKIRQTMLSAADDVVPYIAVTNQHDAQVLEFVQQVGQIAPAPLERSTIGSLTKENIRHSIYRLILTGKLYVNDRLKLAPRDGYGKGL